MSPPAPQQQPADVERFHLNKLEAEFKQGYDYISQFLAHHVGPLTPQELVSIMNYLHAWDQYLYTYQPLLQQLGQVGLTGLAFRVSQMQNDLRTALATYAQMYQGAQNAQMQMAQMQAQVNRDWTKTILETNAHTQQVFDRCMQMRTLVDRGYPMWAADLVTKLGG